MQFVAKNLLKLGKPSDKSLRVLHFVNLGSVGGAERYFIGYIDAKGGPSSTRQGVFFTSRGIHPFFKDALRGSGIPVFDKKHRYSVKLPRFPAVLRRTHWKRIFRKYAPGVGLFWNQLREGEVAEVASEVGLRPVYWERGSGWHADYGDPRIARMLGAVDNALANSHAGARILRYHGFQGDIGICRNGLRPDLFHRQTTPKSLPSSRPLVFATVARLVPYKGIALALHVLRLVRQQAIDACLRVAGEGPDYRQLLALSHALGIDAHVEFCGAVRDMERFYNDVDCLLHPALCEPSSNAVAEAIHFGCPVLSTSVDGIPEIMVPECGHIVEPALDAVDYGELGVATSGQPEVVYFPHSDTIGSPRAADPQVLATALEEIVADRRRYERISERCLAWSRDQYDPYLRYSELFAQLRNLVPKTAG